MYDNIGSKVKGLAAFVCVLGIVASIGTGIALIVPNLSKGGKGVLMIAIGAGVIIVGSILSWIGSWLIYCIGDTQERTEELQERISELEDKIHATMSPAKKRTTTAPKDAVPVAGRQTQTNQAGSNRETNVSRPSAGNKMQLGKCSICGLERVPVRKMILHDGTPGSVCMTCYQEFFPSDTDSDGDEEE